MPAGAGTGRPDPVDAAGSVWVLGDVGVPTETLRLAVAPTPLELRRWPAHDEAARPTVVVSLPSTREPFSALKRRVGRPVVVVPVPNGDRDLARSALSDGADVVLATEEVEARLPAAIRAARDGLVVVSPRFSPALERPPLTPREKQVLALVVMGFTNPEIAAQLVVSENTVKSHLKSAFRRLGVRTRSEAVALITDLDRGLGSGILGINR